MLQEGDTRELLLLHVEMVSHCLNVNFHYFKFSNWYIYISWRLKFLSKHVSFEIVKKLLRVLSQVMCSKIDTI